MGSPLRISIIIPNFNGGRTIRATLQSLAGQNYPNMEIIVVDGGSSDDSVTIIKEYERKISSWISEKDHGQSDAINKGFARATGEIVNWLCSDDTLYPGALRTIASAFNDDPSTDVVAGACRTSFAHSPERNRILQPSQSDLDLMPVTNCIPQPGCFFRRAVLEKGIKVDESLHYTMDFDLWNQFRRHGLKWRFIPELIAQMNFSDQNKSSTGGIKITFEYERIYNRYVTERVPLTKWHRLLRYPLERVRNRRRDIWFGFFVYYPYQCFIIAILAPFYGFRRVRWMNWADFA